MQHPDLQPLLAIGIVAAFSGLAYGRFMRLASRLARLAVERLAPRNVPFIDAIRIAVMPFWAGILLAVYLLLALVTGLPVKGLFGAPFDWTAIPRGVLLGLAESSFSMLLAGPAFRMLAPLREAQRGGNAALEYQMLGQGGWMRSYLNAFEWLPRPAAYWVTSLPLLGEELIFRATAIPLLLPLGIVPAVALSTVAFMAVQLARLPSWYQAVGPLCGALVMGVFHGLLFAREGNLLPYVIAHLTFLIVLTEPLILGKTHAGVR